MDLNLHLALSSAATANAAAGAADVSSADFAVDSDDGGIYSPTRPIYDPTPYLDIFDEPYGYNPLPPPPPPPYNPSEPAFATYTPMPDVSDLVDDVRPGFSSELRRRRWRARRFRSSLPSYPPMPDFEPRLERTVEIIEVEETEEEKTKKAANFECNVCFDMAKEPVVTCCGHLFCWPCLYQWLHVHSHHNECPVCKGEVSENNVIPIYGRGSSGVDSNGDSDLKNEEKDLSLQGIPRRPRGNRVESIRQQFVLPTGSLSDRIASWRRRIDERLRASGARVDGESDGSLQGLLSGRNRGSLTRWTQRGTIDNVEGRSLGSNNTSIDPLTDDNFPIHDGYTLWNRFNRYGVSTSRLAAITADLGRLVGRFANNNSSESPSAQPNWFPEANGGGDQASASSTMAVIEGDVVVPGDSPDPNSAGSSRPIRSRRSSNSSSLDVDGGGTHGHKRRRMN